MDFIEGSPGGISHIHLNCYNGELSFDRRFFQSQDVVDFRARGSRMGGKPKKYLMAIRTNSANKSLIKHLAVCPYTRVERRILHRSQMAVKARLALAGRILYQSFMMRVEQGA